MPEPRVPDKSDLRCVVRDARPNDVGDYASHVARHLAESGRNGSFHFGVTRDVARAELETTMNLRWIVPLHLVGWARAWLLWDGDPRAARFGPRASVAPASRVVGHAELRGPFVTSSLHRALFSIGIERAFVGRGYGEALMREAITWARSQPTLAWIDLQVFASNTPAVALYKKLGFVDVGTCRDAFRMDDGTRIDDTHMVLALR
ncbi:MAG: N-acetyltransferase [Polyangiaceae bacterium]